MSEKSTGSIESYRLDPPVEYIELIRLLEVIRTKTIPSFPDFEPQVREFEQTVQSGRWGFDPKCTAKAWNEIDRLGNIILGPLYSSGEFPWPSHSDAPMAPLLQIDLAEAGKLGNYDLGDGLLQVWLPKDASPVDRAYIRVVPAERISVQSLEEIPVFNPGDEYFQSVDWALEEADRTLNDDGFCYQIVGWSKRFTSQLYSGNFEDFVSSIPEEAIDDEFRSVLEAFRKTLKKFKNKWSPSDLHLFGTFYPVQYKWHERPLPLFCFDGEIRYGTAWGDGSAQVFFEPDANGALNFSFEWACY